MTDSRSWAQSSERPLSLSQRAAALDRLEREHTIYGNPTTNRQVRALIAVVRVASSNTRCWIDFADPDETIPTDAAGDCPGCALLVVLSDLATVLKGN